MKKIIKKIKNVVKVNFKKVLSLILIASTLGFSANAQKPAGLENCGASCYMNASVQCLANIPELRNLLIANRDSFAQNSILRNFTNLIEQIKNRTGNVLNTEDLFQGQGAIFFTATQDDPNYPRRMQDSSEFLTRLLDILPPQAQNIFTTEIQTKTKCLNTIGGCSTENTQITPYTMIGLGLENANNVNEALNNFFQGGIAGELKCDVCGKIGTKNKTEKISKLPNTLILHLKRYQIIRGELKKDNKPISFPVNNLDLQNHLIDPILGPAQYELTGIVCHIGNSLQGGHYYSYVKDATDNNWYQCDDRNVAPVDIREIEKIAQNGIVERDNTPFILFYQRKENVLRAEAASEAGPPLPIRQTAPSLVSKAEMKYEEKETDVDKAIRLSQETAEAEEIARQVARKQEELDKTLRFRKQQEEALAAIQKQREEIAKAEQERLAKIAQEQKDQEVALLLQKQFEAEETQRRLQQEESDRLITESLQRQLEEQRRLKLRREQEQKQHQEEFRRQQEIAAQRRFDEQKRVQEEEEQRREEADRRLAEQVQREEQERLAKIVPAQPQIRRQPVAPAQPVKVAPLKEVPQKINDPDIKNKFKKLNELFNKKAEPKIQIRLFEAIKKLLVKYNIHLEQKELDQSVMDYLNSIIQK